MRRASPALPAIADDSGIEVDALGWRARRVFGALRRRGRQRRGEPRQAAACAARTCRAASAHCALPLRLVYVRERRRPAAADRRRHLGRPHHRCAARQRRLRLRPVIRAAGDTRTVAEMPAARKTRAQSPRPGAARVPRAVHARPTHEDRRRSRCMRTFPWCVQKCPYCDFNSYTLRETLPEQRYLDALMRDLDAQAGAVAGRPLVSVFLGGGTPSLFSPAAIGRLLDHARDRLGFADGCGSHDRGESRHHRARPIQRISRRRRDARVAGCAEFRRAPAEAAGPHSLGRRNAARGGGTARRRARKLQSRSDVRAAGANRRGRGGRCATRRSSSRRRICRSTT